MSIQDSLDRQQAAYNLSTQYTNNNSKNAMKNLYKQQLDQLLNQKNKQKEQERNRQLAEKRQQNLRGQNNKQSERVKEQAYKNYYSMLLNNQEQLQSSYVSPFSMRDNMKDQHINHSIEEGELRLKQWEVEERKRQLQRKNMYRSQLKHQIQERHHLQMANKEVEIRNKSQYQRNCRLPNEIQQFERMRHLEDMTKYKHDLDQLKTDKDLYKSRIMSEQHNIKIDPGENHHHTLVNPMPYNIQNPYIIKQMNRQSYLATRGQHLYTENNGK